MQIRRTAAMTQIIKPKEPQLQVADILHNHLADYQKAYSLWPEHKKDCIRPFKLQNRASWRQN
jgi:hypothetical protein